MVEQKEKKLFYIQLFDNFFQTEDIISIKESVLDENINPNDAIIIYQKLILTSIKNNGLIQCSVVSPQIIKNKIGYESNLSRNEDIKTIEQVILILEKLSLIVIADNAVYLTKAIQYATFELQFLHTKSHFHLRIKDCLIISKLGSMKISCSITFFNKKMVRITPLPPLVII